MSPGLTGESDGLGEHVGYDVRPQVVNIQIQEGSDMPTQAILQKRRLSQRFETSTGEKKRSIVIAIVMLVLVGAAVIVGMSL